MTTLPACIQAVVTIAVANDAIIEGLACGSTHAHMEGQMLIDAARAGLGRRLECHERVVLFNVAATVNCDGSTFDEFIEILRRG